MEKDKIQDGTLEELEKTTDLLKNFEPRISKEKNTADLEEIFKVSSQKTIVPDYREEPMVIPVYEDVDQLESAPIPSIKEKKQEKVEEMVEEIFSTPKQEKNISIESSEPVMEQTEIPYTKEMKKKRLAKRLMITSLLFIPALFSALIVANHSHLLITSTLQGIIFVILGLAVLLLTVGIVMYVQNRNSITISPNKIWKKGIYSIFMGCYIGGCVAILLLLYGPSTAFKDWLVTTAMATMSHQHYCKWFYNETDIADVFSRNYIEETGDSTNPDLIDFDSLEQPSSDSTSYENEYERIVLDRNPDDIYKLVTFNVNGCKAYLAIVYDPSKVHVTTTNRIGVSGQYVTDMAKREKALVAINGAGFYDPGHNSSGGKPRGITIVNGKIVTNNEYRAVTTGGLIGFTKDNKLVLLKNTTAKKALEMGIRDAVSWGPFLIVNGVSAYTKGNGGWGYAARTAIGQRADGIVLFLVVDSNANRTKGANMVDLTRIMENYGAINATNLDGGTSSVMVEHGELISNPIDSTLSHQTRPIATSFIVSE